MEARGPFPKQISDVDDRRSGGYQLVGSRPDSLRAARYFVSSDSISVPRGLVFWPTLRPSCWAVEAVSSIVASIVVQRLWQVRHCRRRRIVVFKVRLSLTVFSRLPQFGHSILGSRGCLRQKSLPYRPSLRYGEFL